LTRTGWLVLLTLMLSVGVRTNVSAQASPLTLSVGPAADGWPLVISVGGILDEGLRDALRSALPVRFHLRAELWRKRTLDRLVAVQEISVAVVRDPLGEGYTVESASGSQAVTTPDQAQAALAGFFRPELVAREDGRHYYIVTLEVETLSLSDLDELRRWLRGEVAPALEGGSNPARAVERGVRRLLVRVIGLPTRRFEARTGTFIRE
jgi:hypothetical protein